MSWIALLKWINPKRLLYIAGAAVLAFAVWQSVLFVDAKYQAEAEVAALTTKLAQKDEALRILYRSIAQREDAQGAADAARDQIDSRRSSYEAIRRETAAANEEQNGPLAPVLRDALRALDGL